MFVEGIEIKKSHSIFCVSMIMCAKPSRSEEPLHTNRLQIGIQKTDWTHYPDSLLEKILNLYIVK